ncbi:metallophosphoesterase [candidate division KSB1 bacterium]
MHYKRIQGCLFLIMLLFCTFNGVIHAQEQLKITQGPYLTDPSENGITVVWTTNYNCLSWVEYGTGENLRTFPTWGSIPVKVYPVRNGLVDAYTKLHKVRITGLEPGKKYKYRIVSTKIDQFKPYEVVYGDTVTGMINKFETLSESKQEFTFLVTSDVHERAADLDTLLVNSAPDEFDFLFLNGDVLDWFENEEQIFDGFLDVCVDRFAKEVPFFYIRGNHETRGYAARDLIDYFSYPDDRYYFSFQHGPVYFIVLDTGEDKEDSHPVYAGLADFDRYRSEQAEWLKEVINSDEFRNAEFRIAVFHMPPYTARRSHGITQITEEWGPLLNEGGIDLAVCGHMHRFFYQVPREDKNTFPVLITDRNMLAKIGVTPELLKIEVKGKDGKLVDSFDIRKKR